MSDDNKEGAGVLSDAEFEQWLRTVCFQKPTPEVYDLARSAYRHAAALSAALSAAVMPAAPSDAVLELRRKLLVMIERADTNHLDERYTAIKECNRLAHQLAESALSQTMQPQAAQPAGQEQAGAVADGSTPGVWFVRKRERDGELLDCFIAAPDCNGFAYDAEILGDDEYREDTGMARKLADCELICKLVNAHRAAPGAAIAAREQEPVISVEDSLRTRLRWSQEKVEQLEQENRELRGRLPGPSFDDLMAAEKPAPREESPATPQAGIPDAPSEALTAAKLRGKLLAAANYIDVLGGDSKNFRASLAALTQPTTVQQAGHCERQMGCVCGGDTQAVRERCGNWVKGGA